MRGARPWRDVCGGIEAWVRKGGRKILVVDGHDANVAFDVPDRRPLFGARERGGKGDGMGLRKAEILSSCCRYQRRDGASLIRWLPGINVERN